MRTIAPALMVAAALAVIACGGGEGSGPAGADCATKKLYGRTLTIRVVGKPVSCAEVKRVVAGPCRDGKKWSCFSFYPPDPVLVWFLESERFRPGPDDFSTAIEARRYPCSEARVTRADWRRARLDRSGEFPTKQQVLADDLVRCKLLRGMTRAEVARLLGAPDAAGEEEFDKRFLDYVIGPERDSFFQVDSESLSIEFDRKGVFKKADFAQG